MKDTLTIKEVATRMGVSYSTVFGRTKSGYLPPPPWVASPEVETRHPSGTHFWIKQSFEDWLREVTRLASLYFSEGEPPC